jgi:hypothetical protein
MNATLNELEKDIETIEINNELYVKFDYIKAHFDISADRLKKWREGRGEAKTHPLKNIKLGNFYLYRLKDISNLKNLTD